MSSPQKTNPLTYDFSSKKTFSGQLEQQIYKPHVHHCGNPACIKPQSSPKSQSYFIRNPSSPISDINQNQKSLSIPPEICLPNNQTRFSGRISPSPENNTVRNIYTHAYQNNQDLNEISHQKLNNTNTTTYYKIINTKSGSRNLNNTQSYRRTITGRNMSNNNQYIVKTENSEEIYHRERPKTTRYSYMPGQTNHQQQTNKGFTDRTYLTPESQTVQHLSIMNAPTSRPVTPNKCHMVKNITTELQGGVLTENEKVEYESKINTQYEMNKELQIETQSLLNENGRLKEIESSLNKDILLFSEENHRVNQLLAQFKEDQERKEQIVSSKNSLISELESKIRHYQSHETTTKIKHETYITEESLRANKQHEDLKVMNDSYKKAIQKLEQDNSEVHQKWEHTMVQKTLNDTKNHELEGYKKLVGTLESEKNLLEAKLRLRPSRESSRERLPDRPQDVYNTGCFEMTYMKKRIQELEKDCESYKSTLEFMETENDVLKDNNSKNQNLWDKIKAENVQEEHIWQNILNENNFLREENSKLAKMFEEIKHNYGQLENENKCQQEDTVKIGEALQADIINKVGRLEDQRKELQEQKSQLENMNEELSKGVETLSYEKEWYKQKVRNQEENQTVCSKSLEREKIAQEASLKINDNNDFVYRIETLKKEIETLENEKKGLVEENETQSENVQNSDSKIQVLQNDIGQSKEIYARLKSLYAELDAEKENQVQNMQNIENGFYQEKEEHVLKQASLNRRLESYEGKENESLQNQRSRNLDLERDKNEHEKGVLEVERCMRDLIYENKSSKAEIDKLRQEINKQKIEIEMLTEKLHDKKNCTEKSSQDKDMWKEKSQILYKEKMQLHGEFEEFQRIFSQNKIDNKIVVQELERSVHEYEREQAIVRVKYNDQLDYNQQMNQTNQDIQKQFEECVESLKNDKSNAEQKIEELLGGACENRVDSQVKLVELEKANIGLSSERNDLLIKCGGLEESLARLQDQKSNQETYQVKNLNDFESERTELNDIIQKEKEKGKSVEKLQYENELLKKRLEVMEGTKNESEKKVMEINKVINRQEKANLSTLADHEKKKLESIKEKNDMGKRILDLNNESNRLKNEKTGLEERLEEYVGQVERSEFVLEARQKDILMQNSKIQELSELKAYVMSLEMERMEMDQKCQEIDSLKRVKQNYERDCLELAQVNDEVLVWKEKCFNFEKNIIELEDRCNCIGELEEKCLQLESDKQQLQGIVEFFESHKQQKGEVELNESNEDRLEENINYEKMVMTNKVENLELQVGNSAEKIENLKNEVKNLKEEKSRLIIEQDRKTNELNDVTGNYIQQEDYKSELERMVENLNKNSNNANDLMIEKNDYKKKTNELEECKLMEQSRFEDQERLYNKVTEEYTMLANEFTNFKGESGLRENELELILENLETEKIVHVEDLKNSQVLMEKLEKERVEIDEKYTLQTKLFELEKQEQNEELQTLIKFKEDHEKLVEISEFENELSHQLHLEHQRYDLLKEEKKNLDNQILIQKSNCDSLQQQNMRISLYEKENKDQHQELESLRYNLKPESSIEVLMLEKVNLENQMNFLKQKHRTKKHRMSDHLVDIKKRILELDDDVKFYKYNYEMEAEKSKKFEGMLESIYLEKNNFVESYQHMQKTIEDYENVFQAQREQIITMQAKEGVVDDTMLRENMELLKVCAMDYEHVMMKFTEFEEYCELLNQDNMYLKEEISIMKGDVGQGGNGDYHLDMHEEVQEGYFSGDIAQNNHQE